VWVTGGEGVDVLGVAVRSLFGIVVTLSARVSEIWGWVKWDWE
jgi:hypothetical protein